MPAAALWSPPPDTELLLAHRTPDRRRRLCPDRGRARRRQSAALRILSEHLTGLRDLCVGTLTRPQAKMADFYRELGQPFSVPLSPNNRWHSAKSLREKWLAHIEAAAYRPVLIIDEAQEMNSPVLSELRLLASAELDSRSILTIILAGDQRLANRLEEPDLLPVASRIRSRLRCNLLRAAPGMPQSPAQIRRQPQTPESVAAPDSLRTRRRQLAPAHEYGQRSSGRCLSTGAGSD